DVVLSSSALSALSLNAPPPAASYTLSLHDRSSDLMDSKPKGVRFDGDKGWIQLFDEGAMASDPPSLINAAKGLEGTYKVMAPHLDRKSTRLNSSHSQTSYAVFCLKKKTAIIVTINS